MATKYTILGTDGNLTDASTVSTSAGAGDADKIPSLNASGRLDDTIINAVSTATASSIVKTGAGGTIDVTFLPSGVGPVTKVIIASEALSAGDQVNIYDNSGTLNCRKADADGVGTRCDGFVIAAVSSGANATVYQSPGIITGLSGLTRGTDYFLSTTAGGLSTTVQTAAGKIVQRLGKALSTTELAWSLGDPYVRA